MKKIFILSLLFLFAWNCTKASGQGSVQFVVTGNVHGQLDPCG
jgi:hypothetical protein